MTLTSESPVATTSVPQAGANPVSIWHTEHTYFKRLLDLLDRQVEVFESGQRPNYDLMLDILTYLREYSDAFHHPREDVAFERLERHHPELAPTLARLRQEHRVIANAGEKLFQLLTAIVEDSMIARAEVESAAATYLVYYGRHIEREDSDVITHAARSLTAEDWEAVRAAVPAVADPLINGNDTSRRFRELRRQIALEA